MSEIAEPEAIEEAIVSPTLPAFALLFVVVPTMPFVCEGVNVLVLLSVVKLPAAAAVPPIAGGDARYVLKPEPLTVLLAASVVNDPVLPLIGVPVTPSSIVTIPVLFATEIGLSVNVPATYRPRVKALVDDVFVNAHLPVPVLLKNSDEALAPLVSLIAITGLASLTCTVPVNVAPVSAAAPVTFATTIVANVGALEGPFDMIA
ncbi:hypothetical protein [Paraburkholderia sp. HD33-4]|uniref:hypothetical protein n=1 Tax=Paraburkholderia sp. HD33-4 TaxID=2883242 RepID=UPI001F34B3A1|nr:hypothetical protein [Paraburkholderia sp. HD33-4]